MKNITVQKMKTEIIIHNSVSLDGSPTGFMPDMELHYQIAGDYRPDAHLIGSDTVIAGFFCTINPTQNPRHTGLPPPGPSPGLPTHILKLIPPPVFHVFR